MARIRHYSDFITSLAGLVGVPTDRVTTELAASFNTYFNSAIKDVWTATQWHDICPKGEARFVGNRLTYPNDLSQTAYWTSTAVTVTRNSIANPLDGATNASRVLETAANSGHSVVQNVTTFFPSATYTVSFYARPTGRSHVKLSVYDGATTYSAFYNVTTGVVGTTSNTTATNIVQQPNGYYLCQLTFTASASATTSGTVTVALSTDGSTTSYLGDVTKGMYFWGCLVQQTSNTPISDLTIPWEQTGEEAIESLFDMYQSPPSGAMYPRKQGYIFTPDGIQIINSTFTSYVNGVNQVSIYGLLPVNPVFLYYRKMAPDFTGSDYSATATYAVNDQVYFTNSSGKGDYYKCIMATTTGQSPDTTAASWSRINLYNPFFQYCVYRSAADWLVSDGQQDKASAMYGLAEQKLADAIEVQERQMGDVLLTKMQTHLTSRTA